VDEDSDPSQEEIHVNRAREGQRDNPTARGEGEPEERGARAQEESGSLEFAGPESAALDRTRVGEESRHGRTRIAMTRSISVPEENSGRVDKWAISERVCNRTAEEP